ncbi:MAG: glycosyltransferase [Flavobacteriaceae bacterium]|jgi:glycosyltransferase involved in cell wall biosynthesis|nr:glycosyltransferase [Flavobacteriaceae bacterium]MDA9668785.1 glycosyltransferase [Flavobacteriaceae bacterium]
MFHIALIIPCYNEASRFPVNRFVSFLKKKKAVSIYFVNDGSSDNTDSVLEDLRIKFPEHVSVINQEKNEGKAAAVRLGMNNALRNNKFNRFAFLDADLSTSIEECILLSKKITKEISFVFGSRIKKLDNKIQRKAHRFIIGRVIATFISKMLRLPIYDSQCGCKIFSREWTTLIFNEVFLTRWLFDVEIFYRLINHFGRTKIQTKILEVPLSAWIDSENSKVSLFYGIKVWFDLLKIYRHYK